MSAPGALAVMADAIRYERKAGAADSWIAELVAAHDAVAELIAACDARDGAGYRPSWQDIAVDCSGHLANQAHAHDAAHSRYFAALARCKGGAA